MGFKLFKYPVNLNPEQQESVEHTAPRIRERGSWMYHNAACQTNHVYVLQSATREDKAIHKWLKRWLGEVAITRRPILLGRGWKCELDLGLPCATNIYQYIDEQRIK